jgi:hypothetical protein
MSRSFEKLFSDLTEPNFGRLFTRTSCEEAFLTFGSVSSAGTNVIIASQVSPQDK